MGLEAQSNANQPFGEVELPFRLACGFVFLVEGGLLSWFQGKGREGNQFELNVWGSRLRCPLPRLDMS